MHKSYVRTYDQVWFPTSYQALSVLHGLQYSASASFVAPWPGVLDALRIVRKYAQ